VTAVGKQRQLSWFISLALTSATLTACATSSIDMAPDRPDRPWVPGTNAAGEIIPGEKAGPEQKAGATYTLPANSELAVPPPPLPLDPNHSYSLAELIDIAQSNNPLTRTAWNKAREAALAAGIAKSTYLPRLTATAIGGYQLLQIAGPLGTTLTNQLRGAIPSVFFEWLLFDFGERDAIVKAADQVSVASNIGFTGAHQKLIYDVSLAFYAYAATRARERSAIHSLKNAESVEAAAEDRMKRGIGTVVEVSQARQATAQARLAKIQATGAAQNAYLTLISAIGISPLTQIKIADVSHRKLSPDMERSVEKIISDALARRPDVLAAYAAYKASLANVRAAEAEFLPKVFASGTASYNAGALSVSGIPAAGNLLGVSGIPAVGNQSAISNLSGGHFAGIIFGGVAVPVYDGGTRAAILEQAQAKSDNAGLALTRTRDEAVREIVLANNTLRTSLSAHKAATAAESAAKTTFEATLTAYRSGAGSITDATMAQTQLLQARNASTDTYSTALSAAATVALATGSLGAPLQ
jgi:outer membrane protein